MPVVLLTYILRKVIVFFIQSLSSGKINLPLLVDDLTLRSKELEIIVDSILKLEPGQQYYFGSPPIDGIMPHLGMIALLAWQINIAMKWGQYKLLGKNSGLTGIFTPVIDLGMIRLFFLVALPVSAFWFFNPILVDHPIAYPFSLYHYFNATSNNAGVLLIIIPFIILINSPLIAKLSGAPGLIVHDRHRVIDSIANSFKFISVITGLKVIGILIIICGASLYISAPGSVFQFPVADAQWAQWLIKGVNIFALNFLWSLAISGMSLLYYSNIKKLALYN